MFSPARLDHPDQTVREKSGLTLNDRIQLGTVEGDRQFTIRGIMKSGGMASAFGGNLAIMDVYAAQRMFGRGRTFDRIDVGVNPGRRCRLRTGADGRAGRGVSDRTALGTRAAVRGAVLRILADGEHLQPVRAVHRDVHYLQFVRHRRRSGDRRSGILRALGATREQILPALPRASAIAASSGSIGGLALGTLIARVVAASIGTLISDVYGVAQRADEIAASPGLLAAALGIGIATSIVAAMIPARNAARVDPVQALQKGKYQVLSAGEYRLRAVLAAIGGAGAVVCLGVGGSRALFYTGYVMAIVAALLISPLLAVALARAMRPVLKRLRPVEGALAADSLLQAPRRTSKNGCAHAVAGPRRGVRRWRVPATIRSSAGWKRR